MELKIFQVDAFTNEMFKGAILAGACILNYERDDR
jgi:predicted PhzF superfamily epimerase YddE/YHI9